MVEGPDYVSQFIEPGEQKPLGKPLIPKTTADRDAIRQYDISIAGRIRASEGLPKVDFEELQSGDVSMMVDTEGRPYYFHVVENMPDGLGRLRSPKGLLVLPDKLADQLGIPTVLPGTTVHGSQFPHSSSLYVGGIQSDNEIHCRVPLASLGPILDPSETSISMIFDTPRMAAVARIPASEVPEQIRGIVDSFKHDHTADLLPVNMTPDMFGMSAKDVELGLYNGVLGIRRKYWVQPETGQLFKNGQPMVSEPNVWDIVRSYDLANRTELNDLNTLRIQSFLLVAMNLGLKPPEDLVYDLREQGYSVPNFPEPNEQ